MEMKRTTQRTLRFGLLVALAALLQTAAASAVTEVVTTIDPFSTTPTPGNWYEADIRGAGAASIEDLAGSGGNLEANAPLPDGAALLTTGVDTADKAEIGVPGDFGLVGDIVDTDFELAYSYFKEDVPGGNAFAAPSIKLTFFNFTSPCPSPDNDCFVTLVYEPTWNQPGNEGSSVAVPTGDWQDVVITSTSGLFWGTGGFGLPNTAGGPPLRTLADWVNDSDASFAGATLVQVSVGVGTFNVDQVGYFDAVSLITTGPSPVDVVYDFETTAPPEGTFVDFYHAAHGGPVQAGYVGVDGGDASDGTPVVVDGLSISLASEGVETNGTGIDGRDRGALDASQPLSDLARDFAFAFGEDMVLTIDGLAPGIYRWTGYFHDSTNDQGLAELSLSVDGGATFPFGPKSVSHSTTDDPPAIARAGFHFSTDGTSPVVVRISNSDLPTPAVRPILDGFDLVPSEGLSTVLQVDWYDSGQGASPVQDGYVGVDGDDASDGTPVSVGNLTLALESLGTEVGGSGTAGRDRGALDASQELSDLARDFVFAWGEDLAMTIGGLPQGIYLWTGYFHDSNLDQGDADVSISTDGGSTFPVGPQAFSHSTGTNPPEIATQTLVFETDGAGDVVVKISNPDLPTPGVRPILDGFDLHLLDSPGVFVDFFHTNQGNTPVQPGFAAVDGADASDGTPVLVGSVLLSLASGGVESGGSGIDGRDRTPLGPGPALASSKLARDFVFAFGEDLLLTIDGLEAGEYSWVGFFHDSDLDQGVGEVSLSTDGGATFTVGPEAVVHSTTTTPPLVATQTLTFTTDGTMPVVVRISNPDLPNPAVRPILDGFVMQLPEPGVVAGLAAGVALLGALRRRRRG